MKLLRIIALILMLCEWDKDGKKADCKQCDCSTSNSYGDHNWYHGTCLSCGATK